MSEQNPVFSPGPTNIPDVFHKACDIVSMDYRSSKLQEKFFASDIWGVLPVLMASSGISTAEMALVDLSFPASLGSGV